MLLGGDTRLGHFVVVLLDPFPKMGLSPLAAILQTVWVFVLLRGLTFGKQVTTVLMFVKVSRIEGKRSQCAVVAEEVCVLLAMTIWSTSDLKTWGGSIAHSCVQS